MVYADLLDDDDKSKLVAIWKGMDDDDKGHFINQVALALSIWGNEERGRHIVVEILGMMCNGGSNTLADFGLYIDKAGSLPEAAGMEEKIRRAAIILEGYRIKNGLPSEPHHPLEL